MTKEEIKAYHHQWYEAHKAEQREKTAKWQQEHPELMAKYYNKYNKKRDRKVDNRKYQYNYLDTGNFKWEDVEGYDGWTVNTVVHHRLEMFGWSADELKAQDRYYNCTPDELLCLSIAEHNKLHAYLTRISCVDEPQCRTYQRTPSPPQR